MTITLIIFSVFFMNLSLQCALGIRGIACSKTYNGFYTLVKTGIIFITVVFIWFLLSLLVSTLISGIFIYVLLFPLSYIAYEGFEYLMFKKIFKKDPKIECFIGFPGGITAAAVFICLNIAANYAEAILLSFGFSFGILLVCIIIREIRRRAALEIVPEFLRGKSLVVISMGLLSLIFGACSLLLLRMISIQ